LAVEQEVQELLSQSIEERCCAGSRRRLTLEIGTEKLKTKR
jgi:hypothetical protein